MRPIQISDITRLIGSEIEEQAKKLFKTDKQAFAQLRRIITYPTVIPRIDKSKVPHGIILNTVFGTVRLDSSLKRIESLYINNTRFEVTDDSLDAVETLIQDIKNATELIGPQIGRPSTQRTRRKVIRSGQRQRRQELETPLTYEELQEKAFNDLSKTGLTYANLHNDLRGLINDYDVIIKLVDEIMSNKVTQEDLANFIIYQSNYKNDIISRITNTPIEESEIQYTFERVTAEDDSFAGRLLRAIQEDEAELDKEAGVMKIGNRYITNIPYVDEYGVYHKGNTQYVPHYIGYFSDEEGSRSERLRVIDPVQNILDALELQFVMTDTDVRFPPINTVTRNLPDLQNYRWAADAIHTLSRKVVLAKSYGNTNSMLADLQNMTDELGAVTETMLDDESTYRIDPYGTANGSGLGMVFFLTEDAVVDKDGRILPGKEKHSKIGKIMNEHHIIMEDPEYPDAETRNNSNRNQMTFMAMLNAIDSAEVKVAIAEFGLHNADDAVVSFEDRPIFKEPFLEGDKIFDFHGNKSTTRVIDPNMSEEEAKAQHLEYAVKFAQLNPDLQLVTSPLSLASRLNFGVVAEGLKSKVKQDLILPTGEIIKDGIVELTYLRAPQTAEKKSKYYSIDRGHRRAGLMYQRAVESKIGKDLYREGYLDDDAINENKKQIVSIFTRLGVSFHDESLLIKPGNIVEHVTAKTIDGKQFMTVPGQVIRQTIMNEVQDGKLNILLDDMEIISPLTDKVIVDELGRNILPIRLDPDGTLPFRYVTVLEQLALRNKDRLQNTYEQAIAVDYSQIVRKDNLLKNVETMKFKDGTASYVLVPDPTLALDEVRVNGFDEYVTIHRDPCLTPTQIMTVKNVGGGADKVIRVNPLIYSHMEADNDGDLLAVFNTLTALHFKTPESLKTFIEKMSPIRQLNFYGKVNLHTGGSHFLAACKANGIDSSDINFNHGQTEEEIADKVNNYMRQIVDSPKSYGAYGFSFTDEQSIMKTVQKIAEDGIKGNADEMLHRFKHGYNRDENREVLRAVRAKTELTGLSGKMINDVIAAMGEEHFDPEIYKLAAELTKNGGTQPILQMKKDASKLPVIYNNINEMKIVMSGTYDAETSRTMLKTITEGYVPEQIIDKFVDLIKVKQTNPEKFGSGIINNTDISTTKMAYTSAASFNNVYRKVAKVGLER